MLPEFPVYLLLRVPDCSSFIFWVVNTLVMPNLTLFRSNSFSRS